MTKIRVANTRFDDVPVAGMKAGTFAIWDAGVNGDDWEPAKNPKQHLSKVAFHSDLDYIGAIQTIEASESYPSGNPVEETRQIGSHNLGYRPFILGQVSTDGSTWYTCNGTTYVTIGAPLNGRFMMLLADENNVYVRTAGDGNSPAQTLYFRVHILERSFYNARPDNGVVFHADANYMEAGGGVFDTRRRYLQTPSPGQAPTLRHNCGETIQAYVGDEQVEIDVAFGTDANNFDVTTRSGTSTSPPWTLTPTPYELVFAGTETENQITGFDQTGRVYLSNADGDAIFDTSRQTLSFVDEFTTEIHVPQRGQTGFNDTAPQQAIHFSQPVTPGAEVIFGWAEFLSSQYGVAEYKPVEFSGSIIVTYAYHTYEGWVYVQYMSIISPRIRNGNLEIVETWWNRDFPYQSNFATPDYTVRCHFFTCALTGGF